MASELLRGGRGDSGPDQIAGGSPAEVVEQAVGTACGLARRLPCPTEVSDRLARVEIEEEGADDRAGQALRFLSPCGSVPSAFIT